MASPWNMAINENFQPYIDCEMVTKNSIIIFANFVNIPLDCNNSIFTFPYISLCKTCDPGQGHFWPQGQGLNKLSRGPLDNASYLILRL